MNMEAPLGSIENPIKFEDQDFRSLLEECLKSGELFCDPTFAAVQESIGMPVDSDPKKAITWKRPKEISDNAVFVEGTTGTTDICQGQLGNCWLLAALSCLTMHPKLFVKVVPSNQTLTKSYAGIFHFRFWQYGEWVEVVVDDRLPTREGRLLFSYSHTRNEYWSPLVEKAYAKLVGSYGSLKGGNISEGMEDFTGGIAYSLPVSSRTPRVLWRMMTAAIARGSLLSCFIQAMSYREVGKVTSIGLIKGHAYCITDTDQIRNAATETLLLRLRNPWGFIEYTGPWSDKGNEWNDVDKSERERIKLKKKEDGEFWINVEDFSSLYDVLELCSVNPDSHEEGKPSLWSISEHDGIWVPGSSAGGSRRNKRSFWKNPQFELVLTEQDLPNEEDVEEDDDEEDDDEDVDVNPVEPKKTEKQKIKEKKCTVLVELLQKDRRQRDKIHFLYIGFHIYRVPPEMRGTCLDQNFFIKNRPVGRSGKYKALRGVRRTVHLVPGHYILVPSTYRPDQPGEFFVRIFSKTGNTLGNQDFTCSFSVLMVMAAPLSTDEEVEIQKMFDEHAGPDNKLNVKELMQLLNSVLEKQHHLPLETCRQLIFTENTKGRSRLDQKQAQTLLANVRDLQSIFVRFDEDSSGNMSPFELGAALQANGMQCDAQVLQLLSERFASGDESLPFHGFVSCVIRLRTLFAQYESETSQDVKDRGINAWLLQFLTL